MARPDILGLLDVAYRTSDVVDSVWLADICKELRRTLDAPLGCAGFFLDASDLDAVKIGGLELSSLDVPLDPRVFVPANAEEARPYYGGAAAVGTGSKLTGGGAAGWRATRFYREFYQPAGVADILGIVALDAQRRGCVLAVPLDRITSLSARESRRLTQLTAHLSAALRLRRALRSTKKRKAAADAILDPSGKLLDAHDDRAAAPENRTALRDMARHIERSRTASRRADPDAALTAWTALVSGRWTLLDHFDNDGRRFLVAHKNAPELVAPHALDEDERTVAAYAALGRSGKSIAYELGLPAVKVTRLLQSALSKLGLRNAAELASTLGAFVPGKLEAKRGG